MSTEHSLWLMPSGDVRQDLTRLISELAVEHSTPPFLPHVTLIGELASPEQTLVTLARQVASRLKPYEIRLGAVDALDEFHRSLFAHVEETPPVLAANRVARQVLKPEDTSRYMPHMSLLYSNLRREQKEPIIAKIGTRLNYRFTATSIYLYSTLGDTTSWYCVAEFPLAERPE